MRASNPVLSEDTFSGYEDEVASGSRVMTVQGTVLCTFVLLGLCSATAVAVWGWLEPALDLARPGLREMPSGAFPALMGSAIAGLVLVWIISSAPKAAPYLSPFYAIAEGGVIGTTSVVTAVYYKAGPTMVLQAGLLTFGILAALLLGYITRFIQPTEKFKAGVFAGMIGIALVSLASLVLGLFGMHIPYLWQNGVVGIGFSAFVVFIASMNLVLDFDFIEQGAQQRAPKYLEWYGAFGLLVTLVWLYISILRLLRMLNSRN